MRKFAVPFAAIALTGCVNLAPEHVRPPLATAAHYPQGFENDVTLGQRATDVAWRDFFADPQLEALIARAIERNRDLAVAVARIEEARGLYRIQDADRLPTVGASADAVRSRGPSPSGPGTDTSNRYSVGVGVTSFELDFWGRVRNLSEAALQQYLGQTNAQESVRLTLLGDVVQAWLNLAADQQRLRLAQDTLASREKAFALTQRMHELGATSGLVLAQNQTTVDSARLD